MDFHSADLPRSAVDDWDSGVHNKISCMIGSGEIEYLMSTYRMTHAEVVNGKLYCPYYEGCQNSSKCKRVPPKSIQTDGSDEMVAIFHWKPSCFVERLQK